MMLLFCAPSLHANCKKVASVHIMIKIHQLLDLLSTPFLSISHTPYVSTEKFSYR